jgi:hypothetical protein
MQIDFGSSGGVANQELIYQADTNTLPENEARELQRLVESSGAFELQQSDINPNVTVGRADVITYRISLSEGERQTTLWMNDVTAPVAIRPLLAFLQDLALERKNKGR